MIPDTTKEGGTVALRIANTALTPDGTLLNAKQAIAINLRATSPDPRIALPATLVLPANQAELTTMLTVTRDNKANQATNYTIALSLPANTPATLSTTTVQLKLLADKATSRL